MAKHLFTVVERRGWYEVESKELGVLITAKSIDSARQIASKVTSSRGDDEPAELVIVKRGPGGVRGRLQEVFVRSRRDGNA